MSFTEGNQFTLNKGELVTALDGRVGSFIIFVWTDDTSRASATFAMSKNDANVDWKRLSCVKDVNGLYICPYVDGVRICFDMNEANNDYTVFNVKMLG